MWAHRNHRASSPITHCHLFSQKYQTLSIRQERNNMPKVPSQPASTFGEQLAQQLVAIPPVTTLSTHLAFGERRACIRKPPSLARTNALHGASSADSQG